MFHLIKIKLPFQVCKLLRQELKTTVIVYLDEQTYLYSSNLHVGSIH